MQLIQKVYAQVGTTVSDPLAGRFTNLAQIFGLVINIVIGVGIALTIVFLALGGIKYMTSQGDVKAKDAAQQSLTNAIIGFVVVLGAITIKVIVGNIIGATNTTIPTITDF